MIKNSDSQWDNWTVRDIYAKIDERLYHIYIYIYIYIYMCVCVCVCVFVSNLPHEQETIGYTKNKEPSLLYYLIIAERKIVAFYNGVHLMRNKKSLVQDLNSGHRVHFLRQ